MYEIILLLLGPISARVVWLSAFQRYSRDGTDVRFHSADFDLDPRWQLLNRFGFLNHDSPNVHRNSKNRSASGWVISIEVDSTRDLWHDRSSLVFHIRKSSRDDLVCGAPSFRKNSWQWGCRQRGCLRRVLWLLGSH